MDKEKIDVLREKIIEELEKSNLFFHVKNKFYKMLNSHYEDFFNYVEGFDDFLTLDKESIKRLKLEFIYLDGNNLDNEVNGVLKNKMFENRLYIRLGNRNSYKSRLI